MNLKKLYKEFHNEKKCSGSKIPHPPTKSKVRLATHISTDNTD